MRNSMVRYLIGGLAILLIVLGAISLFTPLMGRARLGPMRDFAMGPMSFGMMREAHAMADLETEFDYMVRMIPHHQEAVDNARVLREGTERAEMRAFAEEIIATQTREIRQMETWLAQWYAGRDASYEYQPMMRDYSGLSGDELDLAFLQDMIPHHMAAVMMSQQLLSRVPVEHAALADLAAGISATQSREIRQMSLWLDRWFN